MKKKNTGLDQEQLSTRRAPGRGSSPHPSKAIRGEGDHLGQQSQLDHINGKDALGLTQLVAKVFQHPEPRGVPTLMVTQFSRDNVLLLCGARFRSLPRVKARLEKVFRAGIGCTSTMAAIEVMPHLAMCGAVGET